MRQRIAAFGGVGAAALLGFLLLWGGIDTKPLSAMEQMAENVRKAKSFKYNLTVRITRDSAGPGVPSVSEHSHVIYKLAPGTSRIDSTDSPGWKGPGPECTEIYPVGRPGIDIDHREKEFRRCQPRQTDAISGRLDDLQNLGNFSGEADRELGVKDINGKKARGFQIDMKKINGDSGTAEIWLDAESSLPLVVRYEVRMPGRTFHDVISDIQWNDLDERLFDTTPPDGYTDTTPKPPSLAEQRQIVGALKIFADASGGHYPKESGGDTDDELIKMLGLVTRPSYRETEGNAGTYVKAAKGFDKIAKLKIYNPDAAYYGKTVGAGDKEKVLLRWQLDDGRYEVIFGDLRNETVTAEKLHVLEAK